MSTPTVAVIMRTKSRPALLKRAVGSVAAQSLNDYTLVIVNDGGDKIPIQKLIESQSDEVKKRIVLINNSQSLGLGAALNSGVKKSSSKYITVLDDDDTWHKDFLNETISYLETNSDYKGVVTVCDMVQEKNEESSYLKISQERFTPYYDSISLFALAGNNQYTVNSFVYARECLKTTGLYNENLQVLDDWDFNLRFLKEYDIALINKTLAYYHKRIDDVGSGANTGLEMHLNTAARILNKYLRDDLKKGSFGLGITSNLSHQTNQLASTLSNQGKNAVELRSKIEEISNRLTDLADRTYELEETAKRIDYKINSSLEYRTRKVIKKVISPLRKSK